MVDKTVIVEIFYRALDSEVGIVLRTNNVERLRAKCYAIRAEAQQPAFEELTFTPSRVSPDTELWVVRKQISQGANRHAPTEV